MAENLPHNTEATPLNELGFTIGVPVPGIGELFWTEKSFTYDGEQPRGDTLEEYIDNCKATPKIYTYSTPDEFGRFSLALKLTTEFRQDDGESYFVERESLAELLGEERIRKTHDGWGETLEFPGWLLQFAEDLQDWLDANFVNCFDNHNKDSEGYRFSDALHIVAETSSEHDFGEPKKQYPIKNHRVFLGSLATHMAQLKAQFDQSLPTL